MRPRASVRAASVRAASVAAGDVLQHQARRGRDGENGWSYRKPGVLGMLPFHKVELAGLQEVLPNQRDDLAAALPEYAWFGEGRDANRSGEACLPPRARGIIDYVFVGAGIDVLGFGVLPENWDLLFPSDHRPIVADLTIAR